MSTSEQNFDRYLRGEPLTEELGKLKTGTLPDFGSPIPELLAQAENQSTKVKTGRISRADRVALKEMVALPGWLVLHRLLENATLMHQEKATLLSQGDPLANAQAVAQAWAYVNLHKRVIVDIDNLVIVEIKHLEEEEAR
jgi:hypothetical protein